MRYEDMEFINFRNILQAIEELPESTRANIAKRLSLSRTTVSNLVNNLIDAGILEECEENKASRGRPGLVLRYSGKGLVAIGASYITNMWHFMITALDGSIVEEYSTPEIDDLTPETFVQTLLAGLRFILSKDYRFLPAVGLGLPGIVDSANGRIILANDLGWHKPIDIRQVVQEELNLKVYCTNRYTAMGLAEYWYANNGLEKNLVYLGVGSGIRSAIFVNGRLLEGANYSAGRVAHLVIDPNGELCDCGRRGCLLAMANERALMKTVLSHRTDAKYSKGLLAAIPAKDITVESVIKLADGGDECSRLAIDSIALPIAKAINMISEVINPSKLILGGPMGYSSKYFVDRVRSDYAELVGESKDSGNLDIEQGQMKESGSALGASSLVLSNKAELLYEMLWKEV